MVFSTEVVSFSHSSSPVFVSAAVLSVSSFDAEFGSISHATASFNTSGVPLSLLSAVSTIIDGLWTAMFSERLEDERPLPLVLLGIGWKTLAPLMRPRDGVLMGVPGWLPFCFSPGYTILMSEGEGDGAREETALDVLTSQFCRRFRSSCCVGPPSPLSRKEQRNLVL